MNPQELSPHSDNVEEELRRVQLALSAVFSPAPPPGWSRELANTYLVQFQSLAVAWMVCDLLLTSQDLNHVFFAAQTLHTKCRTDVSQLPPESLPSLRESLLTQLSKEMASPVVKTRLAMAIAALAVQMSWTSIVTDLLGTRNMALVQHVLLVLPEECASDRLYLSDENTRYKMRDALIESSHLVLQQELGLELWLAWIRYVPIPPDILVQSVVVDACIQALQSPETMEVAIDVLVELLRMYPSHVLQNYALVNVLLPKLLALPMEQALTSDDEDVVRGYCRIMTELGESYLSIVCENPAHAIVERVLKCTLIQERVFASMTLHFWFRFAGELENIASLRRRQELVDSYTPHLLQLLDGLLKHLQYPQHLQELSADRTDDFHRDRYYIGDTLEDCCRLLGGHTVLLRIGSHFPNPIQDWQSVEACFFAIQCIHRYIPNDELQYLPRIMTLIPQLPPDVPPLRFTACAMIGKYAPWLAAHPDHLHSLLPYLADSLKLPECARAASVAIKELCDCISLGDSMLSLYNSGLQVELQDELELLEGVCRTVSRDNTVNKHLASIVRPLGNRWHAELHDSNAPLKVILAEVERLTVIVRFLKMDSASLLELMRSSWQLLDLSTQRFPRDFRLAETACRLHKHALRACTAPCYAPLFDSLTKTCVESFEWSHQSPYLYLASICITEYGRDPAFTSRLLDMVNALAQTTFGFLQSLEHFILHPDVVEELFYCMGRMMNYCPASLTASPLLPSLFQCAVVGMQLDHRDANRGTMNFLEAAVGNIDVNSIAHFPLETVVSQLMKALVGELPAYSIDSGSGSIAGILWKLNTKCSQPLHQWMSAALEGLAPAKEKQDLLHSLAASQNREEFNASVRAFRSACERHRKLAQGSSLPS
jgi:transportin-3